MILITGGMGFVGMHTARRFLDVGERVVITQHQASREPEIFKNDIGKALIVERVDITSSYDMLDVVRRHKVTDIVHLVAPRLGALSPAEEFRVNITGLLSVLEAARLGGVRRLQVASSQSVYTGLPEGPYREETPLPVVSANSTEAFKKTFEILTLHYADRTGLPVVLMRLGGIYGPLYYSMFNIPSRMCHAAIKGVPADFSGALGTPYAEDDGDFCYVKDCARGIQMLHAAEKLSHRVYNIGAGRGFKVGEIAAAVTKAAPGAQITVQPGRNPRGRANAYMDLTRTRAEVGYQPEYDIQRGVAEYIGWLRTHPE
jgi:UDP-glucose 4-epimerase